MATLAGVLYVLDISFWEGQAARMVVLGVLAVLCVAFLTLDSLPYMHFALFVAAVPLVMYASFIIKS